MQYESQSIKATKAWEDQQESIFNRVNDLINDINSRIRIFKIENFTINNCSHSSKIRDFIKNDINRSLGLTIQKETVEQLRTNSIQDNMDNHIKELTKELNLEITKELNKYIFRELETTLEITKSSKNNYTITNYNKIFNELFEKSSYIHKISKTLIDIIDIKTIEPIITSIEEYQRDMEDFTNNQDEEMNKLSKIQETNYKTINNLKEYIFNSTIIPKNQIETIIQLIEYEFNKIRTYEHLNEEPNDTDNKKLKQITIYNCWKIGSFEHIIKQQESILSTIMKKLTLIIEEQLKPILTLILKYEQQKNKSSNTSIDNKANEMITKYNEALEQTEKISKNFTNESITNLMSKYEEYITNTEINNKTTIEKLMKIKNTNYEKLNNFHEYISDDTTTIIIKNYENYTENISCVSGIPEGAIDSMKQDIIKVINKTIVGKIRIIEHYERNNLNEKYENKNDKQETIKNNYLTIYSLRQITQQQESILAINEYISQDKITKYIKKNKPTIKHKIPYEEILEIYINCLIGDIHKIKHYMYKYSSICDELTDNPSHATNNI